MTEGRYLLSGASDASAAVYDVQQPQKLEGGGLIAKHKPIFVVDKQHEHRHKYAISSAIWYPIDTGLFVTGSYDHYIKVWDTNSTQAKALSVLLRYASWSFSFRFFHPCYSLLKVSVCHTGGDEFQNAWEGL